MRKIVIVIAACFTALAALVAAESSPAAPAADIVLIEEAEVSEAEAAVGGCYLYDAVYQGPYATLKSIKGKCTTYSGSGAYNYKLKAYASCAGWVYGSIWRHPLVAGTYSSLSAATFGCNGLSNVSFVFLG
jgi:hypothetical protein